ncbi:MAG: NAD(P)H-binding protein [Bacteroidia bacterium]|nr:NAD(P)H-binding protein [Bacteroidia bacterium]
MNILLFGGTGKCGQEFLKQLPAEYSVRCVVRRKGSVKGSGMEYYMEDIQCAAQLREALKGMDAVVSLLGHKKGSPGDLQTAFMTRLVPLMMELNVIRLISLTGSGVPDLTNDRRSGFLHWVNEITTRVIALLDPQRVNDGVCHAKVIMESGLDWTIIRTPLQLGARSNGTYWAGQVGKTPGWYVKREDIVHFIRKILNEKSFVHQLPYLVS